MPNVYGIPESVVQPLVSRIEETIVTTILEDKIFKQRSNDLSEDQRQDDANIVSFFHSNMDKSSDNYIIKLDVGRLETYIETSELNGRMIDVYNYPHDLSVGLADSLAHGLWELLERDFNVRVQINYSTKDSPFPPIPSSISYHKVEAFLKKEQKG
jgi:hypothetical protein